MIYLLFFNKLYPIDQKFIDKSDLLSLLIENELIGNGNDDITINGDDLFPELNEKYQSGWEYVYHFYHPNDIDFDLLYKYDYETQFEAIKLITFFNLNPQDNPQFDKLLKKISKGFFSLEVINKHYYDIQLLPIAKFITDLFIISQYHFYDDIRSDFRSDLIEKFQQYENFNFETWDLEYLEAKQYIYPFLLIDIKSLEILTPFIAKSRYPPINIKTSFNISKYGSGRLINDSNNSILFHNNNPYIIRPELLNQSSNDLKKSIQNGTFPSEDNILNQRKLFGKEFIRLLCFLDPEKVVYQYTESMGDIKYLVSSDKFDKFLTLDEKNLPISSEIDTPDSAILCKYKTILEIFGLYLSIGDTVYHSDINSFHFIKNDKNELLDYIYFKFFLDIKKWPGFR